MTSCPPTGDPTCFSLIMSLAIGFTDTATSRESTSELERHWHPQSSVFCVSSYMVSV